MPRLTTKGQVTIPKAIRERLGVLPGDEGDFSVDDDQIVVVKREERRSFHDYLGYFKHLRGGSTDDLIEEMRGPVNDLGD